VAELSEKEQIEQIRAWWSEYANYVLGGVALGVAILVGVTQYRSHMETQQTAASMLYETVIEAVADGKLDDAEAAADDIYTNYGSTIYPAQTRLAMTRLYMDKGRDQDAANALRAVVDANPDSELGMIARSRLAKVLLYQEKPQELIELLGEQPESAFTARYSESIGDANLALGNFAEAEAAYRKAMADSAANPTVDRVLLQMKIDDLPEVLEENESKPEPVDAPAGDAISDESAPLQDDSPATDGDEEAG